MRCSKAQRWISAGLDRELGEKWEQTVRSHLTACATCRAFAADVAGFDERFDLLTAPEPRGGFTGRIMARLEDPQRGNAPSPGWLDFLRPAPLGIGAAAFCLGVIVVVLANDRQGFRGVEPDNTVTTLGDDYSDALSEVAVEERLLALLSDTEK